MHFTDFDKLIEKVVFVSCNERLLRQQTRLIVHKTPPKLGSFLLFTGPLGLHVLMCGYDTLNNIDVEKR